MTEPFDQSIAARLRLLFGDRTILTSLQPLAGDASSRRYYRAVLQGPSAPPSAVIMQVPAGASLPLSSEELAVFKEPPKELPFLNLHRFLARLGVRIPRLYGSWEREGILVLEDLGDVCLWDRVQGLPASDVELWYRKAIDVLLRLQIGGTARPDESCLAFQQRFDFRLYMWEFDHFLEYGLEKRPGGNFSRAAAEQLRSAFKEIARCLDALPPCLNHRDYHSWNLMVRGEEIVVIDFQDALLAPAPYDLASLLNDRETDRVITAGLERNLLGYYLQRSEEMGAPRGGPDEFLRFYLLSAIQRDFKVVGRFYYLDLVKGKPAYRKFIPPTLRRLRRNLARLPETEALIPLLAESYEEMR
ncbi:MAG TPA: phosphotransferase [candidate division Zixibacteria bacterium]|nr:phosphotransferase [candidate division Zixibacteria bacterium]